MWEYSNSYLQHHGILGQKWGIRRFQNEDGSLTSEGIKRYRKEYDTVRNMYGEHSGYAKTGIKKLDNYNENYHNKQREQAFNNLMRKIGQKGIDSIESSIKEEGKSMLKNHLFDQFSY